VAHLLYEPHEVCYTRLVALLGKDILDSEKRIDKAKLASIIFNNNELLEQVNEIVHPAVRKYITSQMEYELTRGELDYLFIEAALLIEEHYDEITDEIWYIYASKEVRRLRLAHNRNYSDEKISSIMAGQLDDEEFRKHSQVVITNNGDLQETYREIDKIMGERHL
jgi:dephospho-CoA kinase